jgi:PAS domain S-box-containing protein
MSTLSGEPQPISLLCVDDDEWVLDLLKTFFSREADFSVFTSSSGPEALELIGQYQFDAIIADYSMPDIDGITLLQEIRSQKDSALFIMFTGRHLAQVAIETLNNGGNYYVQKGVEIQQELPRVLEFIRTAVSERRREHKPDAADAWYRSVVEQQRDLLCSFRPDGTTTLTNEPYTRFSGGSGAAAVNFLQTIPEGEREYVKKILLTLTAENPGTYVEHHVLDNKGTSRMFQWGYRAFFNEEGTVTEYLAQGRDLSFVVRLNNILPREVSGEFLEPDETPSPVTPVKPSKTPELTDLGDSIENLQYPIFAINKAGIVIAWNKAIAELTGIEQQTMVGKGDYAYAFPIYGEPRPMLIDYIVNPPVSGDTRVFPPIVREGDSYSGEVEEVTIRGRPMKVWGKGTAIWDGSNDRIIAAVQSLIVSEQPGEGIPAGSEGTFEHYIGGVSSIILKVAGEGLGGAIAGAIGSATGGYGVYATDQRLFVIHNKDLDASRSEGVQFGEFLASELFGTNVDMRPRAITELEQDKVYEVWRKDIASIEMKTPRLFSGFLIIRTKSGGSFRIYVDHRNAFNHLEQLLKLFYPEILQSETGEIDDADTEWLDEIRTFELVGKLQLNDPLKEFSSAITTNLPTLPDLPRMSSTPVTTLSADRWDSLNQSVKNVPYPIFAIDLNGRVIAWNDAIAKLTGIEAKDIMGKGDFAYSVPFYGERRHMLIDYLVMPPDAKIPGNLPTITREGDTFFGSLESVTIRGKPMLLLGKCTGIYDSRGSIIASIQSILVSEQPSLNSIIGIYEEEQYIGGLSSITVKLPGSGVTGAIAGAIGSTTGGYGVYATDQRLFIIHNKKLDATNPNGVQFGAFILDELFGTTVDTTPRSIEELAKEPVYELARKDIITIEMKKPLLFAGYINFRTRSGESIRIYIDHKKAFMHLDQLLRMFYPEILRIE